MIITIDMLRRINSSVASGDLLTLGQLAEECGLDVKILELLFGDLTQKVPSMAFFFNTMEDYLKELHKRIKILSECYTAIQRLQIENNIIEASQEASDPPIVW